MPAPTCCPFCHSDEIAPFRGKYRCFICGREFSAEEQTTEPTFTPLRLFISYGHTEHPICRKIADALTQRGHQVWFDEDKLHEGLNWRKTIAEGLEKSNGVVACISDHYVRERSVCLDELNIAIGATRGEHVHTVLLGDESTIPTSLCYNQWLDMRDWEERMNGDPAAFEQWFQANMQKLFAILETADNRAFSGAIQTLQEKLQVSPNTSRQSSLLKKPFVGRQWLTEQVVAWLDDPAGERLCFLSGDPGVGKSAFAANFTHYNPRVAAALFCWAGENRFNDPRAVLKMLAFLLACRIPDYRSKLLIRLDGENRLGEYNERELFRVLLEEPLHGLIDGGRETLCIVIDGLDEAGTAEENLLAETLGRYMPLLPPWLRVLVTGRPVAAVTQPLGSGLQLALEGRSQENLEDVRQYFEETLRGCCTEEPNRKKTLDELTRRSHGIFLYAELVCQGILAGKLALTDWDKFPDGLQDAFTRWFQWFFPDKREFEDQFALPLGAICAMDEPLPLEELRRVFGWNESQLHRFLRRIDVLLEHGESVFGKETVTLSHKYIGEWLTDPHRNSLYFVSVGDAKKALAGAFYDRFRQDPKGLTEFESLHLYELQWDCGESAEWFEVVFSNNLCWNLINAGDYCKDWGHMDEAMKYYRCGLSVTEQRKDILESLEVLRNYIAYAERIGELEQTAGNRGAAREWYEKGLTIAEQLAETYHTPQYQQYLNEKLGDLAREDGDWLTALKWYEKDLDITERLVETRGTPQDWWALSISYRNMGDLAQKYGNLKIARYWYEKSLTIREQLAKSRGIPEDWRDLSISYNNLGDLAREDGDRQAAREWYEKSLFIRERLAETRDTPQHRRDLSVSYSNLGGLAQEDGDRQAARGWYEKALTIAERLVKDRGTPQDQQDLNFIYNKLAYLAWDDKDWKAARDWYEKALDIAEQLTKTRNVPSDWGDLCISYNSLGNLAREEGDRQTAWNWCEKALEIAERLVNTREAIEDYDYLAITLLNLAYTSASEQERKRLAQRGLAISDKLYKQTRLPKHQKYFDDFNKILGSNDGRAESSAYDQKGDAALESGDLQAARGWYEKALEVRKQQEKACSTPENQRNLRVSYFKLGIVSQEARDVQTAQSWYEKSLDNAERLAESSGTYEDYHDLIISLWGLSAVCSPAQEQVRMAQRALSVAETLYKQSGEPRYQSLAEDAHEMLDSLLNSVRAARITYEQKGDAELEHGGIQEARNWYRKSLGIAEQLVETRGTVNDYEDLAVSLGKLANVSASRQERMRLAQRGLAVAENLYQQTGLPKYQTLMKEFRRILKSKLLGACWQVVRFVGFLDSLE